MNRSSAFETAPMDDLIAILLRQFRRPLMTFDVEPADAEIDTIAAGVAARKSPSPQALKIREALIQVVHESEAVFAGWEMDFQQSLRTEMGDMPGWETTAEFLDLANIKSNAELRVAGGSALVLALGDARFAEYLLFLIENPRLDEVSTIMATRIARFVSHTEDQSDWLAQFLRWLEQNRR